MEKKTRKCENCMPNSKKAIFELTVTYPENHDKPFMDDRDAVLVWVCMNCGHKVPFKHRNKK